MTKVIKMIDQDDYWSWWSIIMIEKIFRLQFRRMPGKAKCPVHDKPRWWIMSMKINQDDRSRWRKSSRWSIKMIIDHDDINNYDRINFFDGHFDICLTRQNAPSMIYQDDGSCRWSIKMIDQDDESHQDDRSRWSLIRMITHYDRNKFFVSNFDVCLASKMPRPW